MTHAMLQRLVKFGSSLEITWGEDDKLWTVAWITGGKRFNAAQSELDQALRQVWIDAAIYNAHKGALE